MSYQTVSVSTDNPNTGASILFAGNLPPYVKGADIENAFARHHFAPVRVVWTRFTFSRGFSACLEFESPAQADLAMATFNLRPLPHIDPQVLLSLSRDPETPSQTQPQAPLHENGQYPWLQRRRLSPSRVGVKRPLWNPPPNAFQVPVDGGCKDTFHGPPEHMRDTMQTHNMVALHPVAENAPAKGNICSSDPPCVTPSTDRACLSEVEILAPGIGLSNADRKAATLNFPSIEHAADSNVVHTEESDPPLVPQPGDGDDTPETCVDASPAQDSDLSIPMPGTWYETMEPFIASEQTPDTWTNLFHKLPADETGNLLVYLDNMLFKLIGLLEEQRTLRETLNIEEEKVKIQEAAIHDQEVRHQEQARQQQEKTKSDLRILDTRYAAHQRAELIKHGLAMQNAQAEHESQLGEKTVELLRFRMENVDLKESMDAHTTTNQAISLERDSLKTELAELKEELKQVRVEGAALQAGRDRSHQSFLKADAGRLAKEGECRSLCSDVTRLSRENQGLTKEVESLRIEVSKYKLQEMRRREAEERRLLEEKRKEEERRRQEEERRRQEEARREEEKRLLEEKRKEEEKRRQEEARREEERRLREEEKRRQEEERRRAEAERERQAKEAVEKEEQARKGAATAEDERCRKRDTQRWGSKPWTPDTALERFHVVMTEFLAARYSPMEPVTRRSIPWPILHSPDKFTFEEVTWENVERFLKHLKKVSASDLGEHTKLLKKVQTMFHPDRWSSRNILQTVGDGDLEEALRKAGKIVSQAVNQWIDKQPH